MTGTGFEVKTIKTVTREQVGNLLSSAFEGGSNYWYRIEEFHAPTSYQFNYGADLGKPAGFFKQIDYPLNPEGYLIISDYFGADETPQRGKLNYMSIKKGLNLLANSVTYAHHWRDFLAEEDDASCNSASLER